jgi:dTMP kinase
MHLGLTPHTHSGVLVTVDGIDGSGKTTLITAIRDYLREQDLRAVRAVVYTMPSQDARRLRYFRTYAEDHEAALAQASVDFVALCFVLLGDRLMTIRTQIIDHLKHGDWILCDRYIYTAFAELSFIGCSDDERDALLRLARLFPAPDLPIITDAPTNIAIDRIRQRPEEANKPASAAIFEQFAEGFRQLRVDNRLLLISTGSSSSAAFEQLRPEIDRILMQRM